MEQHPTTILVAPLNWGLGHAARCIPIIRELKAFGFRPILASDGQAFELLKKEFPDDLLLELPSYQIEYAKEGRNFKWKMLKNSPRMIEAVLEEHRIVKGWVKEYGLDGIISDNRLGVFSKKVPSVFMTHQLNVLSGNTSWITTQLHLAVMKKFTECWIPDFEKKPNLTGKLGHVSKTGLKLKYIGPLSRLEKQPLERKYDLMVILSGPEPQRGMLEEILRHELSDYPERVVFIRGVVESEQVLSQEGNITFYNYMDSAQLQQAFNESRLVICRSGYTTLMDLAKLGKKAFLIPTPGQTEQEYLARRMKKEGMLPYASQEKFKISQLSEVPLYSGLPKKKASVDWKKLFCLFEGK